MNGFISRLPRWPYAVCLIGMVGPTLVAEEKPARGLGGPSSVESQLIEDAETRERVPRFDALDEFLSPWFEAKSSLQEGTGLNLSFDYTSLGLATANGAARADDASGGIARFFGSWALLESPEADQSGALVFKAEHRHRYGAVAPQNLGFASGYNGIPGTAFSDYGWGVTNFFWRHSFGQRAVLQIGLIDATDYVDIYGLVNPWTAFQNLAFSTNPAIPVPNQGLGVAAGVMLNDHFYLHGGLADANGDPTRSPFQSVQESEWFKHLEVGWVSSHARRYFDNVHLTAWHVDSRELAGVPDDWGLAFSATRFIDDRWMPFFRAGWADGTAALYDRSVSVGVGHYWEESRDLAGIGLNWGRPSDPALDEQWTAEIFYRFHLAQNLAVTPSVQLIGNPALNPEEDVMAYFGLRARLTF